MSSGDVWHEANAWPTDPDGDMTPILEASIEQAKQRHPSGADKAPGVVLTQDDRCDQCNAAAAYRVTRTLFDAVNTHESAPVLDFCLHHWRKNFPPMVAQGWAVTGGNPALLQELGQADGT